MKKLVLLGAAHIHTPNFLRILQGRSDFQVTGVWDHNFERAQEAAAQFNCQASTDLTEILEDKEALGAIICSETKLHAELVANAVKAGKHLFVEKPLGMQGDEALQMADMISRAGLLFQTGYFMRGNPIYRFLKEHIALGTFGKITRMRLSNCHAGLFRGYFDTQWRWMADPEQAGCGAFGDLGTHVLDLLLWFYGMPETVTAQINQVTGRFPGCDESGEALLSYADGCIASIAAAWVDWADPMPFMLSGTEGYACIYNQQFYVKSDKLSGAGGLMPWTQLPEALPHAFELFLEALHGRQTELLVTANEAAQRNVVMQAIYEAAAEKTWKSL
ncbi:MAG: Gfo/Idh/MocA family oxidoreductase [Oligosphaeraceae bacterium]|nr:Gfo/Idh/MocA family oxidoreductase [Oligosphaeraceae bacterium]